MNVWQIVIGSVMMLVCLIIIAIVLLQQGRRSGVSAISGGADTFLAKSKSRSKDAKLARLTKVFSADGKDITSRSQQTLLQSLSSNLNSIYLN